MDESKRIIVDVVFKAFIVAFLVFLSFVLYRFVEYNRYDSSNVGVVFDKQTKTITFYDSYGEKKAFKIGNE